MIDFQDSGLRYQVFKLIAKMCELSCSDEYPRFQTKQIDNDVWECKLSIPGVKRSAISHGKTEVEAINYCAICMLHILEEDHDKDQFDPDIEESIFEGNISQYFGDVDYNPEYRYHLHETDILIDSDDTSAFRMLKTYASETIDRIEEDNEEIDSISEIVTIRLLVKEKKKNLC